MKIKLFFFIILCSLFKSSANNIDLISINPGIKISYSIGNKSISLSPEISVTAGNYWNNQFVWSGIVLGFNLNRHDSKYRPYLEIEAGDTFIGTAIGYNFNEKDYYYRFLIGAIEFISLSNTFSNDNLELNSSTKLPLILFEAQELLNINLLPKINIM